MVHFTNFCEVDSENFNGKLNTSIFGGGGGWVTSPPKIVHSYGDVIITGGVLLILTYTRHSWPKTSNGSVACHTYCDLSLSRLRFEYREVNTITDCATAAAISTVVEFISIVAKLSVCVQNHLCLINVKVPYTHRKELIPVMCV